MIIDLLENAGSDQIIHAGVCIIGSGAAGISLAREFIGTELSVVVLEGGGRLIEPEQQKTYQSRVVGLPHMGIHAGRARAFGGTTQLWAGQALPLFEADFRKRDWVSHSGWPIVRDELLPFYYRAEDVMQIRHVDYGVGTWPRSDAPPFASERLVSVFSQFAAEPNFATKYGEQIKAAKNITVLLHANVTSLEASENADHIMEVRATTPAHRGLRVRAGFVVVCAGGIETARLLLLSDSVEKNGLGNRHDVVGRFFQDHPHTLAPVRVKDRARLRLYCNSFRKDNIRISPKMVASAELQREAEIPHVGAEVFYPTSGEDDPLNAAKAFLKAIRRPREFHRIVPLLGGMARDPYRVASAAYRFYIQGQPASVGSTDPHVGFFCEQEPNPDSRVLLDRERDNLGLRRTILDWRLTGTETKAVEVLAHAIDAEWKRLNIGEIMLDRCKRGPHGFVDLNHHMGTARMGNDPRLSVVDPQCRVHGYDNLYIGSSATFPTGGFSNPTLTVIALVLRIADELKVRLRPTSSTEKELVVQHA